MPQQGVPSGGEPCRPPTPISSPHSNASCCFSTEADINRYLSFGVQHFSWRIHLHVRQETWVAAASTCPVRSWRLLFRNIVANGNLVAILLWGSTEKQLICCIGRDRKSTRLNSSHVRISY